MSLVKIKQPESVSEYIADFCQWDIGSFLLRKLKLRYKETYLHAIRVAELCAELAAILGLPEAERVILIRSACLHDVGKLGADNCRVKKRGPFLHPEWTQLKADCRRGADLLKNSLLKPYVDLALILYHHENLDGTGYFGLKGGELSLGARILRVADSYDAMTWSSMHRSGTSVSEAIEELYRWSDIHYDAEVVMALYKLKVREGCHE